MDFCRRRKEWFVRQVANVVERSDRRRKCVAAVSYFVNVVADTKGMASSEVGAGVASDKESRLDGSST